MGRILDLQSDVICDCAWSTSFTEDTVSASVSVSTSLPDPEGDTSCCCCCCGGRVGTGTGIVEGVVVVVEVVVVEVDFFDFLVALEVLRFFLFLPSASPPSPRTGDEVSPVRSVSVSASASASVVMESSSWAVEMCERGASIEVVVVVGRAPAGGVPGMRGRCRWRGREG